jgi:hypothetical protein
MIPLLYRLSYPAVANDLANALKNIRENPHKSKKAASLPLLPIFGIFQ